ncbi:MAG: tetratricopeptide repeat protein [Planctomycetota bacterium]
MKVIKNRIVGSITIVALSIVFITGNAGCKTDALTGPQRVDDSAPLTSLENPAGVDLPNIPVADRTEVDLVEDMMLHRAMYARYLRVLVNYYAEHGYEYKAIWARNELYDLAKVKPYSYILDAEVPMADLSPAESVAEADKLFEEGRALMKKGGDGIPVFYNQDTMKLALTKFKQLIDNYPASDKIDDAAFYIAEIHKEYFEEKDNLIALRWYQRAIDWNSELPYPARFQMAAVYDYRLKDHEKALEMYQEVVDHEQFNKSNVVWAKARINDLTAERTRRSAGEPAGQEASAELDAGEAVETSPLPPKAP